MQTPATTSTAYKRKPTYTSPDRESSHRAKNVGSEADEVQQYAPLKGDAPPITMTSREIADLTEKQHQHVKRDIEKMLEELGEDASKFGRIYSDSMNRERREYALDRELTETLLTGYSAVLRRKVIARWRELESGVTTSMPQTFPQALRLAADMAEQIEHQQLQIEQQRPAVEFRDRYVEAKGAKSFREVSKIMEVKERKFIAALADAGIIFKQGSNWLPKAEHQNAGYFTVKTGENYGHAWHHTLVTPEGIGWVARRPFMKQIGRVK